jgi:hypothetical protein
MNKIDEFQGIRRSAQIVVGLLIAVTGIILLGFAILLIYADIIQDLPSKFVINLIILLCTVVGILCSLLGVRLVSGKKTGFDGILFSPIIWKTIAIVFIVLALALLVRGRWRLALLGLIVGLLCFKAAHSGWLARLLYSDR